MLHLYAAVYIRLEGPIVNTLCAVFIISQWMGYVDCSDYLLENDLLKADIVDYKNTSLAGDSLQPPYLTIQEEVIVDSRRAQLL